MADDVLSQLQQFLSTAGGMVPRVPQAYPGMRPAAGGNAFAGLPQLAQAGPPGMAGPMQPGAAASSWMQPTPQPGAAGIDLQGLARLLGSLGIGPAPGPAAAAPAGLPPAVQRSITGMPSYGEGEMTPYIRGNPAAILQEKPLMQGPQRDQALMNEIFNGRNPQDPVADGGWGGGWGSGQRGNAYPSPLNQMRRTPLGLY